MNTLVNARLRQFAAILIASIALFAIPAAYAHHSPASFNTKQTVTIEGVVTKIDWFNPHVYIYIEERTATGQKVQWEIECFPPMALRAFGWLKDTVRVGDSVTVSGNPAKDQNSKELFPSVIKRGDRILFALQDAVKKLYDPANQPKSTAVAKSLNGTWQTVLSMPAMMQIGNPNSSKLTQDGVEALKRSDEKTGPSSNCIPSPPPVWMVIPDLKRMTVSNSAVEIEGEYESGKRTIYLNNATHDGAIPSFQGHSVGRWEGKTLIVDTTHFAYHGMGNGGGNGLAPNLPSSTQKHLVERFTLSEDGMSLTYQYDLTDPVFLATPRTGSVQWVFSPNTIFDAPKCTLESARRFIKD